MSAMRTLGARRAFADAWGVPTAFSSLETMLLEQKIDALHVLTPPNSHHSLAKTALQSGCHVFLEKPMCVSPEEADELLLLARQTGLHLGVNHNFLHSGAYIRLREIIQSGLLGPLDHVAIDHFYELEQIRSGPFDAWMLREPGNVVLEIGPHLVSALLDLVGTPSEISGAADRKVDLPGGLRVYRRWHARTTVGRTAIDININLGPGFKQRTIYVRGLLGAATLDFDANTCMLTGVLHRASTLIGTRGAVPLRVNLRHQARRTFAEYALSRLGLSGSGNPYQASIVNSVAAFYSSVATGQTLDSRITGGLGREAIDWCTKIIRAANVGRRRRILPSRQSKTVAPPTILVLGGSGFIGSGTHSRSTGGGLLC